MARQRGRGHPCRCASTAELTLTREPNGYEDEHHEHVDVVSEKKYPKKNTPTLSVIIAWVLFVCRRVCETVMPSSRNTSL